MKQYEIMVKEEMERQAELEGAICVWMEAHGVHEEGRELTAQLLKNVREARKAMYEHLYKSLLGDI